MKYLVILLMAITGSAGAASFDCGEATTLVEKEICSSETLSELDIALSLAYAHAIDIAANQHAVVQSQLAWLRQRNACGDTTCIDGAYRKRIDALKQIKRAGWKTYHNPALGISFEYLANRQVMTPCPLIGGNRCVAIVGSNMGNSDYLIAFEIHDGALDPIAEEEALFVRDENGKWMTTAGRGTSVEAQRFSGRGWRGLHATIVCGISDELGFHAAGGECYWAVLSNGKRAAVANTLGIVGRDDATLHSVKTFKFDQ